MRQKLEFYEKAGVQATMDMQLAARRVAVENHRLRIMLMRRGAHPKEIDDFLNMPYETVGISRLDELAVISSPLISMPSVTEIDAGMVASDWKSENHSTKYDGRDGRALGPPQYNFDSDIKCHDTTSCDVAANIIADLNGEMDTAKALVALGCATTGDCHVKNTNLMQIIDEFA